MRNERGVEVSLYNTLYKNPQDLYTMTSKVSYDGEKHSCMGAGGGFFGYPLPLSVMRSIFGFLAFIPFCYVWGVNNFTLFAVVGTIYFMPVHLVFDEVIKRWM